ncbi:MAG: glycosyltransferase [Lachnospiraceae bacterium]
MKILSVAIPRYNSEAYMRKCIESPASGRRGYRNPYCGRRFQEDNTAAVADSYREKYPTIVKAIHQENGGHGEAVNTGIANASGVYFKVVDSDDWVDSDVLLKIIGLLKRTHRRT